MFSRRKLIGAGAATLTSASILSSAPSSNTITIEKQRLSDIPIAPTIFGQFIEVGFGRQVEGMWAEMLYNRSFQKVQPFSRWTWDWLGLQPSAYNSKAPFWHSGYEEMDWELIAPNNSTMSRTLGTETYKGCSSLTVNYDGGGTEGGLRQNGLFFRSGETYEFRIFGGFAAPRDNHEHQPVRIIIRTEESSPHILTDQTLSFESTQKEFNFEFASNYTGRASIAIAITRSATLRLSWASLMPKNSFHGWRNDVVDLLKQVSPPIIRFPGGCYASFHDWKTAIGPRGSRPAQESYYWGNLDENDIGMDEFLDLCHEIHAEPQILVNMMTSNPFDAADLVEYCNGPDTSRMGVLRTSYKVNRQNRVNYWEMENEARRKWTAPQYASQVVEFAKHMRRIDSSIRLMMENYSFGPDALASMLEIAGSSIDFVITRASDPPTLNRLIEIIRRYNAEKGTKLKLVNTEWLAFRDDAPEPFADPDIPMRMPTRAPLTTDYKKVKSFRQIHWFYALNTARILLDFLSQGGELNSTNFNNCVNTWGQNIIEASKEGAWLSPVGHVYSFFGKQEFHLPLQTSVKTAEGVFLNAQAFEMKDGRRLAVIVINRSVQPIEAAFDSMAEFKVSSLECISAPDRLSRTSLGKSEIKREKLPVPGSKSLSFRPLSITRVELQRA